MTLIKLPVGNQVDSKSVVAIAGINCFEPHLASTTVYIKNSAINIGLTGDHRDAIAKDINEDLNPALTVCKQRIHQPIIDSAYRILKPGEKTMFGDEYQLDCDKLWYPVDDKGYVAADQEKNGGVGLKYRRRLTTEELIDAAEPIVPVGYRVLQAGEATLFGDEYRHKNGPWLPVDVPGVTIPRQIANAIDPIEYRRCDDPNAVKPLYKTGFRMLLPGESIKEGDELLCNDGTWGPASNFGGVAKSKAEVDDYEFIQYRRKLTGTDADNPDVVRYRLLDTREIIKDGDEIETATVGSWTPHIGKLIGTTVMHPESVSYHKVRRIITKEYRPMVWGEIIKDGDEDFLKDPDRWVAAALSVGGAVPKPANKSSRKYRRPMEPGFRLLQEGEVIINGDDYWDVENNCWLLAVAAIDKGVKVAEDSNQYRRKIVEVSR